MAAVLRYLRIFLAILGCLHLTGGGEGLWQGVAWSRMLMDYTREHGLSEGVKETFDGEHPCEMCRALQTYQQRKEKPAGPSKETMPQGLALRHLLPPDCGKLPSPCGRDIALQEPPPWHGSWLEVNHTPPSPPPRGVPGLAMALP